jgi:hypothetical protein
VVIAPQLPLYNYYPYYPGTYYSQPAYPLPDQTSTQNDITGLIDEIQRLRNEVQRLQDELAATQAQQAQLPVVQPSPPAPSQPVVPTVLVFRDGHQIEIHGYAVVGETLWTSYDDGFRKVLLSDLDLAGTRRENLKRGINFLPDR